MNSVHHRLEAPLTVVFFGIQGSGKGTQASMLAAHLERNSDVGVLSIEMGERLRGFASGSGFASKRVGEYLEEGKLLPAFVPDYILATFLLKEFSGTEHLIFDGVGRKVLQTIIMDEALAFLGRPNYQVIVLDLPKEDAIQRLLLRERSDDSTDEQIQARLKGYELETIPAIQELSNRGREIHHVDARPNPEEIHQSVLRTLGLS